MTSLCLTFLCLTCLPDLSVSHLSVSHLSVSPVSVTCLCLSHLQAAAPLVVKPFLEHVTESELFAIMTGGFASIAGAVSAIVIDMGVS